MSQEQQIREQYTTEMATQEAEARRQFEADIAAKRAEAKAAFEAGLIAEKDKSTFEAELAAEEAAAKSQFEAQLARQRREAVEIPLRAAKREYAMTYGVQMLPRHYRALRTSAEEQYKTLAESEKEMMEEQVKTWKVEEVKKQEEAIATWETEQRSRFEKEIQAWETQVEKEFESQVTEWKLSQLAALESQLAELKETEQPAGIAETLLQVEIPSLSLGARLAQALGMKYIPSPKSPFILRTPEQVIKETHVHPLAFPAGVVASVESLVYSIAQFAGIKTPRVPATLTSGIITSGIETIASRQLKASPELQAVMEMPAEYTVGTVFGDVLIDLGISKATKAIKGAAGYVYRESGLKYSHLLYEAKETWLEVAEKLPKSPIAAIKQSHATYEISEALSSIKHKIMPIRYRGTVSEGIIGLPTLEEEIAQEVPAASKVLGTAYAISVTPLEYGKAVYPKAFAGMELLGMAEAPRTAAFGLTVPQAIREVSKTLSPLAEAIAETMWIASTAAEKWAVRAGVIPSPEDVILEPPKIDVGMKMVKGGREFTIPEADLLGFTKLPKYRPERAGELFFEKAQTPTLKDLIKDIKAQTRGTQLLETPAKIVEPVLPKLAMLPEAARKITVSEVIGAAVTLGIKPLRKVRPAGKVSTLAREILKPSVSTAPSLTAEALTTPALKGVSAMKAAIVPPQVFSPSRVIFKTPKGRKDQFPKLERVRILGKKPKKKIAEFLYPVATESEVSKYVLGKIGKKRK